MPWCSDPHIHLACQSCSHTHSFIIAQPQVRDCTFQPPMLETKGGREQRRFFFSWIVYWPNIAWFCPLSLQLSNHTYSDFKYAYIVLYIALQLQYPKGTVEVDRAFFDIQFIFVSTKIYYLHLCVIKNNRGLALHNVAHLSAAPWGQTAFSSDVHFGSKASDASRVTTTHQSTNVWNGITLLCVQQYVLNHPDTTVTTTMFII